jgi:hypothetical protein
MTARRAATWRSIAATAALALCISTAVSPGAAAAADPLAVLNTFCRADGSGARLRARTWSQVGSLVAWTLEPAWDHLTLISGYQVSTPRGDGDRVEVDVQFTVTGEVRPGRIVSGERIENLTYTLMREAQGDDWVILGPARPPHVFASNVDPHAMAVLLAPASDSYESASSLVWRTLNQRPGVAISYLEIEQLGTTAELVDGEAAPGAVALYYDGATPYHAGIVADDDSITSATLNAGVVTVATDSFAGEIRYRHLAAVPPPVADSTPAPDPIP